MLCCETEKKSLLQNKTLSEDAFCGIFAFLLKFVDLS